MTPFLKSRFVIHLLNAEMPPAEAVRLQTCTNDNSFRTRRRIVIVLGVMLVLLHGLHSLAWSQSAAPNFVSAADRLQECAVTIRLDQTGLTNEAVNEADGNVDQITVFTGVCLNDRLVVTPMAYRPSSRVRITMSDGEQCIGQPVVIDEFTGLALLRIDRESPSTLTLADALPEVGEWVVSAAAWGIEKPVVSYGIVGGIDRRIAGTHFPPLLLCDLRSTETSSGAPIVSPSGQLHGIVVATSRSQERGWTYAIPVRHIRRMLRTLEHRIAREVTAREESASSGTNDASNTVEDSKQEPIEHAVEKSPSNSDLQYALKHTGEDAEPIIVIPHRRPVVGMVLEDDGDHIVVAHLTPGGPAEQAGIARGDRIVGLEGVTIRSVYQAVLPTFHYQPGDVLHYQVVRGSDSMDVPILLGGDVALPASSLDTIDTLIDPKLRITGFDELLSQLPQPGIAANGTAVPLGQDMTGVNSSNTEGKSPQGLPTGDNQEANGSAIAILQRAIENYQTVIAIQNERLIQEREQRQADRARLDLLEKELKALRAQIDRRPQDSTGNK